MGKIILIVSLFFICSLSLSAQKGTIRGTVSDSLSLEPVEYASIRLLNLADSTFVVGSTTNTEGRFTITAGQGSYLLEISFLGYKTYRKNIKTTTEKINYNLGNIFLLNDSKVLDEAVVTSKVPDVVVKGDTIEYNADSYISDQNDLLQDVVRKLPGVEIDASGNLSANGKPITKIQVDGKEFFGNDIKMALENLPANMIKKLQLFKEQSETSKVTGFKDGNEEQVLNLKIKDEYKRNLFGDARIGYGNNDRYSNRLLANYMHDENQFSVIGNMNNVNSDSGFGGGYYSSLSGVDKNKNIGTSFAVQGSEKLKLSGSVRYSDNSNLFESQSNTEYFTPSRISLQNSSTLNDQKGFNAGVFSEWKPDKLTTIYLRISAAYNDKDNIRTSDNLIHTAGDTVQQGRSENKMKTDGYALTSSLVIGRKLNDKGRNISLSLSGTLRDEDGKGTNSSITRYSSDKDDLIIDQYQKTNSNTDNWGIQLSYVEPVTSKNSIMLSYSYRQSSSDRDRYYFTKDDEGKYTVIDRNYTRNSSSFSSTQNINMSFQALHDKYEYTIGLNVDPSYTKSKTSVEDSIVEDMKQKVVDYSPTIRFSYKPNNTTSLDFNYRGATRHPGISQLSADTVRSSSGTSKYYGNPDLKVSYSNNLNIYYRKSDYETGRFLILSGSFNYNMNEIVNYTEIDTLGGTWNSESTYKNVNGNWNTNFGVTFNTPLKNKKISVEANSYVYYSRRVGFTNSQKNITKNWNFSESLVLSFRSEKLNSRLQANFSQSLTRNNVKDQNSPDASNFSVNNSTTLKLPFDISIQNDISYTYNSGYSSDFKKTEILWNASISKQLLKNKKGLLKVQFYDILKDRSNVTRTVDAESISDMRTNSISRYFLVSLSYKFNVKRGGKGKTSEYGMDDDYY